MKRLLIIGWVVGASCACAETNVTDAVTNNHPEQVEAPVANLFPVQVAAYEEIPISAELTALFNALRDHPVDAPETARSILIRSLEEKQCRSGVAALRKYLADRSGEVDWTDASAVNSMLDVAGCARCLESFRDTDVSPDVWEWLFQSLERVQLTAETVTRYDNLSEVAAVLETLYQHDPQGRDTFLNLILAMAVVWDTPRTEMHKQMGEGWLAPDNDIALYYDYFKKLYSSPDTKVSYDELSVDSLVFVVDVPAPIRELEWALEHVDGSRSMWGRHYKEITYDLTRLIRKQYDWPHREYTLQEIQECFGICVDQAYFCVITARAHGIPCLYFHGRGIFGGHAWFGFMRKPTAWDLDVGRYSEQGYAIGFAIHPQTDHEMTDHELEYFCSRSLNPVKSRQASALVALARVLHEEDVPDSALTFARKAAKIDPLCSEAWQTEREVLVDAGQIDDVIEQLDETADAFRYFPDEIVDVRKRQATLLSRAGRGEDAEALLRREVARAASKRGDLQQKLVVAQADHLLQQGRGNEGMQVIEEVLREQREEGAKIYDLLVQYKLFAKRAGLSKNADSFLNVYR